MPARPQPPSEDRPVINLGRGDQKAIQAYLAVTDDGEIARLAAMMAPKREVFDARALVAQATALQAEVASELVRRREAIANSMSYATLLELVRHFDLNEIGILSLLAVVNEEQLSGDPHTGPVLRSLAKLVRAMPPPQDFQDEFLAEDPTTALELAASRTALRRPLPDATFEEALRYAANISTDEVSWEILNGAFFDFQRMRFQKDLVMAELFEMAAGPSLTKAKSLKLATAIKRIQQKLASFHDTFTPGKEFPPEIDELAHRAYTECWKNGLLGPLWRRRLAWLVVEFSPFWQRHGEPYRAIHQTRVKSAAEAEAARAKAAAEAEAELRRDQNKKSAKARESGEAGRQSREGKRWRSVTADFIAFLETNSVGSAPSDLRDYVATFVGLSSSLGGDQLKANTLEFLQALCTAVTNGVEARTVLDTLQRSLLAQIEALKPALREKRLNKLVPNQRNQYLEKGTIPPNWVQFKPLTEVVVRDCLEDLKHALSKACVKKRQKLS